jgi:hypothetical protein
VSSRRRVSARVASRRALVVDLACGALLAIVAMAIAAGIGVVGVGALIALLVTLAWVGIEAVLVRVRHRSAIRR